ncbi:BPSL0067 family protein [Brevundimonas sp.]|uniref:BPSL0067 family protein n=1 Tax=Brevundimonas sp. TaxID=1871086 RepID=UPI002614770A|nr:BPSL0067 family protein [Brevundimonas sp.]
MPFVSTNYATNPKAPAGTWVCAPTSAIPPSGSVPTTNTNHPDYCGQCVSYVKQVCPTLPAKVGDWTKGASVRRHPSIVAGTVIATFDSNGAYSGHAAIYVSQTADAINVYDQYQTPPNPKAIGPRPLRFNGSGVNDGDNYFVVEG